MHNFGVPNIPTGSPGVRLPRIVTAVLALACIATLTSCSSAGADDDRPFVLTTFTVIADMARNVGGDHVRVESITKPGAEVHGYEPTPGDLRNAAGADLVLDNGLGLERWFAQFVTDLDAEHVVEIPGQTRGDGAQVNAIGVDLAVADRAVEGLGERRSGKRGEGHPRAADLGLRGSRCGPLRRRSGPPRPLPAPGRHQRGAHLRPRRTRHRLVAGRRPLRPARPPRPLADHRPQPGRRGRRARRRRRRCRHAAERPMSARASGC